MSINTMKLALEALENASPAAWASRVDSDTMKSIWRKHADAMEGLQVLLAELDNASCKSAQKRLEAHQPASKEHLFELWWEAHMPNATQEQAWTAFTAAVASNGVGIAAQQPATPEPVQADSSEHLRVIASLGAALRRLSFAAQTTGGTDGPDAELQSAIGQAEQALSLGGIWQAMSATPEPVKAERDQLRCAQADAVMPLIGPLLDAWENADREVISQEPELSRQLKAINNAMEGAQPATPEPAAWLDEMLADTREVFDAGGSETPQVVRDVIEYVKSWVTVYSEKNHPPPATHPAPSVPATSEPVWCVATGERVNGEETYTHHDAYVPLADCFPLYTHQAPSVPKDDQIAALVNKVRDIARMFHDHQSLRERIAIELVPAIKASQEVKSNAERWRHAIADGENQSMNFLDIFDDWDGDGDFAEAFDAAMLAAKERP